MRKLTDRAGVEALLERVRAATGPDRYLDAEIYWAVDMKAPLPAWVAWMPEFERELSTKTMVPNFTSSLDAIVGLIERELPGAVYRAFTDYEGYCGAAISLGQPDFTTCDTEQADTVPLALCAAFLAAALSESPSP